MRTASDGPRIEQSWSAQECPGDFGSEKSVLQCYVNYANYAYYVTYATRPPSALVFLQHWDVCTAMLFAAIVVLGDTWKEQQDFAKPHCVHSQLKGGQQCSRRLYKNPVLAIGLSHFFDSDANGQHSTRCSPGNRLCPIGRDENSLRWPSDRTELISSRVSRRLRIRKKRIAHVM